MESERPRIVIIGAGLGGCTLAHSLLDSHHVTIIEVGGDIQAIQERVLDVGTPARLDPHVGSGLGGTTALWHNALIEVDEAIFERRWPFPKSELDPWYAAACELLSGQRVVEVRKAGGVLRDLYARAGLAVGKLALQFIPIRRRNLWHSLQLQGRVRLIQGEAIGFERLGAHSISSVSVLTRSGIEHVSADTFVLAAGGLGTPVLLQGLAAESGLPTLSKAGWYYEDHPMGFVGVITLKAPLYKFWNYSVRSLQGTLRMPIVVTVEDVQVSFQLRPAALFLNEGRRESMGSMLSKLRNNPFNVLNYFRVLKHPDDLLDILSFKFGIQIPTSHYSILMVAEQPPAEFQAVRGGMDTTTNTKRIERDWRLPPEYLAILDRAVQGLVNGLGPVVSSVSYFPDWQTRLESAAHHSGTARLASPGHDGVCDANCRVEGLDNMYVADGSVIPSSGIANTGLTICAMALRLGAHVQGLARG